MMAGTLMSGACTSNWRRGRRAVEDAFDSVAASDEPDERRLAEDPDAATALGDLGGEANELKGVSEALFPVEQDRFPVEMFTGPARVATRNPGGLRHLSRHSASGQPRSKSPWASQPKARLRWASPKSGLELDGLVVVSHGLGPEVFAGECHSEIVPGVGGIGPQGQCGAKPREWHRQIDPGRRGRRRGSSVCRTNRARARATFGRT